MFRRIIIIIGFCLMSFGVQANGWLTKNSSARITSINIENDIVKIAYTATDIGNPDGCGNEGFAMLQDETKQGDRKYAALLAAHMSNKPIKLYAYGCYTGWGQTWQKIGSVFIE
jgi:hypothetical protein